MPTLEWIGKDKVINHHHEVPFRILDKKYTFNAESSENMIIHGDNLLALKSLLPQYEGMVDCIYIDPPYNTGNEKWVYNDNVNDPRIKKWLGEVVGAEGEDLSRHDKWLCMMYPRLKLLHKLLSEKGVIFISIDDNEFATLKLICDEIFGLHNFVTSFHWRRTESQNNGAKLVSVVGEFILCYMKNKTKDSVFNKMELLDTALSEYRYEDENGKFRRGTIVDNTRGKNVIEVTSPDGQTKTINSIRTKEFIDEAEAKGLVYWTKSGTPYLKIYLDKSEGQVSNNWLDDVGVNEDAADIMRMMKLGFNFSKPYTLVERLIKLCCTKDSIILDSFAGSGTTAQAVLNLNNNDSGKRKFILVEMLDYAEETTAERLRNVILGYGAGKNKVEGISGDFSFYELGQPLFKDDKNLNEEVPEEEIRKYVYYMETKKPIETNETDNRYYMGKNNDTAYYFYYEKDKPTTLNREFLATVKTEATGYVIYADICAISKETLSANGIVFKKIPRDIKRL